MIRTRLLVIAGASITLLCICGAYWIHAEHTARRMRGTFSVSGNTMTIMSAPIPVLAPHRHEVSDTQIDTVNTPGHGVYVNSGTFTVPFDMWVTDINTVVEHAPLSVIHHLVLFREDRMDPICANRHEQIMVVGADTNTELNLPKPYGVFLKKGTKIYLRNMAHNPDVPRGTGETYRDVSLGLRLTFERATHTDRTSPVALYRIFIDDHPEYCTKPIANLALLTDSFTVPPLSLNYTRSTPEGPKGVTGRYVVPVSGTLMYLGAHTHPVDGGGTVALLHNGTTIGSFTPALIGPEAWMWRTPNAPANIHVEPGDTITVRATYSNPHPLPVPGAMGMGVFVFAPAAHELLLK